MTIIFIIIVVIMIDNNKKHPNHSSIIPVDYNNDGYNIVLV